VGRESACESKRKRENGAVREGARALLREIERERVRKRGGERYREKQREREKARARILLYR